MGWQCHSNNAMVNVGSGVNVENGKFQHIRIYQYSYLNSRCSCDLHLTLSHSVILIASVAVYGAGCCYY